MYRKIPTPDFRSHSRIKFVPPTSSFLRAQMNGNGFEILDKNNTANLSGLYTGGLTYCVALAIVQKDDNGEVFRIGMVHFNGGLSSEVCSILKNRLLTEGFETNNTRLFFYPGVCYREHPTSATEDIENSFRKSGYHYTIECGQKSCSVSLSGEVGSFYYDSAGSYYRRRSPIFVIPITTDKQLNKQLAKYQTTHPQAVKELSKLIKGVPEGVREKLMSITCDSIAKEGCLNKEDITREYRRELDNLPILSSAQKKCCIALLITIIGIVPAAALVVNSFFSAKKRNQRIGKSYSSLLESDSELTKITAIQTSL